MTTNAWPLLLAIFLLLQLLASWYLALYTLLVLGCYTLAALLARRFSRLVLLKLGLVGLAAALLVLPLAWPYVALLNDLHSARPLSLALSLAAAPADYAAAAPFNRLFGPLTAALRARPGFTEENTLFPGLIAPLLALAALLSLLLPVKTTAARSRLLALLAVLLLGLALTLPAPYALLARLLPLSTIIRVPARWVIPALFALAGLAAPGFALINEQLILNNLSARKLKPALASLLCLLLLAAEGLSMPLPLAPVENRASLNPAYDWLAAQPGPVALVELPLHSAPAPEYPEVKRLYASTRGWWGLVNGYSGYSPPRQPALAQALSSFPAEPALTSLQALATPARPLYLLVHPGEAPYDRSTWEDRDRWRAERQPALRPIGQFQGDYLYQVMPPDAARFAGPALATFGQNIRLLSYQFLFSPRQAANPPTALLALYWQTGAPLATDDTVFIHLRAPDGFVRQQADGPPVSGRYPTSAWSPGQVIQDIHPLPELDFSQVDHLALGLYDPVSGERLPAFGPDGRRLAEDALIIAPP